VVSEETLPVAVEINRLRKEKKQKKVDIHQISCVLAEDGRWISSTRIYRGEIDAHGHLGPYPRFYIPRTDAASIVEVMDRCGVAVSAVSANMSLVSDHVAGNRTVAEATAAFPGRLIGYATANPNFPIDEEEEQLEHWLTTCKEMRGIKLHPSTHHYPLTGAGYQAAFEVAERHRVPLLTHTWGEGEEALLCSPKLVAVVAEQHPNVPIIVGHSGGVLPGYRLSVEAARRCPNVYLETCGSFQAMGLVEYLVDGVGADRVLFGTDVTFICMTAELGRVVYARLSTQEKRQVLGLNAARLFGYTDCSR
jgi:hypothetical protein